MELRLRCNGAQARYRSRGRLRIYGFAVVVGERSVQGRSDTARSRRPNRSANPGMSSEKESVNLSRQKPKVSQARFVLLGLAGPKSRPKGVGDGQPVDIPAPLSDDKDAMRGRHWVCQRAIGLARSVPRWSGRKIRRNSCQSLEEERLRLD